MWIKLVFQPQFTFRGWIRIVSLYRDPDWGLSLTPNQATRQPLHARLVKPNNPSRRSVHHPKNIGIILADYFVGQGLIFLSGRIGRFYLGIRADLTKLAGGDMLPADGFWRAAKRFFEGVIEIGEVLKTTLEGRGRHRFVGLQEKFSAVLEA